tara:strand:- start:50 stop:1438 length:1389 start_codon:yes stop_codon:yes gene_type:complete
MNISRRNVEILPLNTPQSNQYSFDEGFQLIQFAISNQPKFLDTRTLRLNGVLSMEVKDATGDDVHVDNNRNMGSTEDLNAALSNRIGVASVFDQITLSSGTTNQTLETIRSYGRYLASVLPLLHSQEDLDTVIQHDQLTASRKVNGALLVNTDVSFSVPLQTGLLSGGNVLPLSQNGLQGLNLEIRLQPPSQVASPYQVGGGAPKTVNNGFDYKLKNISLSYDLITPDMEGRAKMTIPNSGSFKYNSLQHIYSVINSSDSTKTFNFNSQNTLSVLHNFLPLTHTNNVAFDGFSTGPLKNIDSTAGGQYTLPANIKRVSFLKSGVLSPINHEIDVEVATTEQRPMSELLINFIESVKPYAQYNHALISPLTEIGLDTDVNLMSAEDNFANATVGAGVQGPDKESVFGIGCSFDPYRVGQDYKSSSYGVRIVSDLDGKSAMGMYTYVLQENTLSYSPSGITVST